MVPRIFPRTRLIVKKIRNGICDNGAGLSLFDFDRRHAHRARRNLHHHRRFVEGDEAMSEVSRTGVNDLTVAPSTRGSMTSARPHHHSPAASARGRLIGHVLQNQSQIWTHLNLPAIAETEQEIPIGRNRVYRRKIGDVLHPRGNQRRPLPRPTQPRQLRLLGSVSAISSPREGAILIGVFQVYDEIPQRRRAIASFRVGTQH